MKMRKSEFVPVYVALFVIWMLLMYGCETTKGNTSKAYPEYRETTAMAQEVANELVDEASANVSVVRARLLPDYPEQAYKALDGASKALPEPSKEAVDRWNTAADQMIAGNDKRLAVEIDRVSKLDGVKDDLEKLSDKQRKEYEMTLEDAVSKAELEYRVKESEHNAKIRSLLAKSMIALGGLVLLVGVGFAIAKHIRIAATSVAFGTLIISLGFFGALLPYWAVVVIGICIFLPVPFLLYWCYKVGLKQPQVEEVETGK